jgi:hypothetical protein
MSVFKSQEPCINGIIFWFLLHVISLCHKFDLIKLGSIEVCICTTGCGTEETGQVNACSIYWSASFIYLLFGCYVFNRLHSLGYDYHLLET